MRGSDFLDKLELVDSAYVAAADEQPRKKRNIWLRWGAMAACLCVLAAGWLLSRRDVPEPLDLEPITIPELSGGAMGFEGYLCYDISELDNGNPWSEASGFETLPVYRNGAYDPTGAGVPTGLSEEEMVERLNRAASDLGLTVLSTEVISGYAHGDDGAAAEIHAETNCGTLEVQANGAIVYFLPEGGMADITQLPDAYSAFFGFEEPKLVTFGDYTTHGTLDRSYFVYDAAGDDLDDLLNYHFSSVRLAPDDNGSISAFRKNDGLLLAEKLGDYPIIDAEEARERLLDGYYLTSVPYAFPGGNSIGKVELVYRTGSREEILLPYYRFYVLLPDEIDTAEERGLKTYGIYYVPAIEEAYIADMPLYDGSFN